MDYLSMSMDWKVARQEGQPDTTKAIVKIFDNENEFKTYQESKRNKG